jgi:hypothetical protein
LTVGSGTDGRGHAALAGCPELFRGPVPAFDWGNDGMGTTHAAAAILVHLLGRDSRAAVAANLPFMRRLLSKLPADGFEVSDTFLRACLFAAQPAPRAAAPSKAGVGVLDEPRS